MATVVGLSSGWGTRPVTFEDARLRLERAKSGREKLKADIEAWHKDHPRACGVKLDYERGFQVRQVDGKVRLLADVTEEPPKAWGLSVGDILGDLRSALDYAVYALATAYTGQDPPPNGRALEFPISGTEPWFRTKPVQRKIDGLSDAARAYVESVQPYQPGNGGTSWPTTNPLWVLNELVGPHKHRYIHVFWFTMGKRIFQIHPSQTAEIADLTVYKIDGKLKSGAVLADFRMVAKQMEADLKLGIQVTPYASFQPGSAFPLVEVYTGLGIIGGPVEDVLNHLEALA